MNTNDKQHLVLLQRIAHRAMLQRGLLPDFSAEALVELDNIHASSADSEGQSRDLRNLLWCSIDNDDSRDLDQLTVAEAIAGGDVKILVAVADVDSTV
jgi:exoribonuclease-2